jgi:hypothetical protein
MKTYTIDDLQIMNDPIGFVRRNPPMFLGGMKRAVGEHLAARMLSDLIWSRALPAHVNRLDQWWEVSSAMDWLATQDGIGIDAFARIVPFPVAGPNSHHSEILLTAFAEAIVTSGSDGINWVKGDRSRIRLPSGLDLRETNGGRIVIFRVDDTPSA